MAISDRSDLHVIYTRPVAVVPPPSSIKVYTTGLAPHLGPPVIEVTTYGVDVYGKDVVVRFTWDELAELREAVSK